MMVFGGYPPIRIDALSHTDIRAAASMALAPYDHS